MHFKPVRFLSPPPSVKPLFSDVFRWNIALKWVKIYMAVPYQKKLYSHRRNLKIKTKIIIQNILQMKQQQNRISRPEVFCEKGVLRNFTKLTGKHLCQSLFSNEFAGLRPATLLKKRLSHRCFSVNFAKFLRTPFLTEHLWWLLPTKIRLKINKTKHKSDSLRN